MMMASTLRIWLSPAGLFCIEAGRLVIVHVPNMYHGTIHLFKC
jgi:hypothetical protein